MGINKKISRREFLRAAGVVGGASAVSILAAGGPASIAAAASDTLMESVKAYPMGPQRQDAVEVIFWQHFGGESRPKLTNTLIEEYKDKKPNVTITYETTPIAEYDKKLLASLAGGSGPDMFAIGDWNFALYTSKQWLSAAEPAWFGAADTTALVGLYLPNALEGLVIGDKLYGIPNEYNVLHTYYRADQFTEVGLDPKAPPTAWQDWGDAGAKLTVRDAAGNMTRAGFQWPYRPPMSTEWTLKQFHPLIYQLGGDVLSADGKTCTLNSPEGIHAAELYLDFVVKYKCSEPGYTINDKNPEFWQGRQSIDLQGPWGAGLGKATDPALYAKYPDGWAVTNFPKWDAANHKRDMSPMWRWAWVVNGASKLQAEAWEFINFMSEQRLRWLQDVGDIPARKGWENDPSLKDLPWLPIQLKDFAYGVPVPQTPLYFEILEALSQGLERIITERGVIKESLDEAAKRIDDILKPA
jgi:multiple sugar transport system substrate-binding protein